MHKHIYWLTQTFADVPENDEWLGENERLVLARLRFPKRRRDWRLGRWTAKCGVCAYKDGQCAAPPYLEILAAPDGAPEAIWKGKPAGVSLSISHSHERSFCVVGPPDAAVGCDLEYMEPREESFIRDYFAPEEISLSEQSPPRQKALVVNLIWSAKESSLKALRQGLRRDTRSIVIHPDFRSSESAGNTWTGHCLESSRVFCGHWWAQDGYIHTIASDCPGYLPEQLC